MPDIINIAGYQFVPLTDLRPLRERLLRQCKAWGLRGTILLSPEGVNLFVAGEQAEIDLLLAEVRALSGLEEFSPKVSISSEQPFNRMLVRIKKEIIAFGVPGIDPGKRTSPKLPPAELKRWLDEGRPVTLLDTRNEYEVKIGTFENAVTLGINHFRNFPAAVSELPAEMKQQPIVMFCTGGIRCEKAGPFMEREGFEQVFQLEGGILKYFEECGGEHYRGECFVFDQRVGVDPNLAETDNTQCFHCLSPLSAEDQADARYVVGESCPYCFLTADEQQARSIAARETAIAKATSPLPGKEPYDNFRPINIPARCDGFRLIDALRSIFSHLPPEYWETRLAEGLLLDADGNTVAADSPVRAGERYLNRLPATSEPDVNVNIRLLYEDVALVIVNKPAPLPLHPSGRFNRNTLQSILNTVYAPQKLRPIHRLDANTTGVVVFARTSTFARQLQTQFTAGTVKKKYFARVHGQPQNATFICDAPIGTSATELGGRAIDEAGAAARTEFRLLQHFDDGTTLVEAIPITGRTNQIRLHLAHLGLPIVGDQAYVQRDLIGETQTHRVDDPPLCLHAAGITLIHPLTKESMTFSAAAPMWTEFDACL